MFGELNGLPAERASAFLAACNDAAIVVEPVPHIRHTLWEKFVFLTALAGTTTLTRLRVKFVRETPETRGLWPLQVEEFLQLPKAGDVNLGDYMMQKCVNFLESLAPTNYSSLYQDLANGRRLELDALHGHAVQLGTRHGVPTPTLFAVYAGLRPYLLGTPMR